MSSSKELIYFLLVAIEFHELCSVGSEQKLFNLHTLIGVAP